MKKIATIAFMMLSLIATSSVQSQQPRPDHVVIVIDENHGFSQIIGSTNAPYINSLTNLGALFTSSHGVTHPSQPNYLALFSGSTQGVTDDTCPPPGSPYTTPNLGYNLLTKGFSFAGYSENLPIVGSTICTNGSHGYVRKHNAWVDWQGTFSNQYSTAHNLPLTSWPSNDFTQLPTVSFVVPTLGNDMHDGTIKTGDTWLKNHIDSYVKWAMTHNSLLILTYDEDNHTSTNTIPTIFVGPMVKQKVRIGGSVNHYNMLRTIEDMYGTSYAGASATAAPITNVWLPFVRSEAENATRSKAPIRKTLPGYSGTGYTCFTNVNGYVKWTFVEPSAIKRNVLVRYSTTNANQSIKYNLNGVTVTNLACPVTGTTWASLTAPVSFITGTNTFRIYSVNTNGPDVDFIVRY